MIAKIIVFIQVSILSMLHVKFLCEILLVCGNNATQIEF